MPCNAERNIGKMKEIQSSLSFTCKKGSLKNKQTCVHDVLQSTNCYLYALYLQAGSHLNDKSTNPHTRKLPSWVLDVDGIKKY